MTESNKTAVEWNEYTHGMRLHFPNGYSLSIIPGYNGDTLELALMIGDEFADLEDPIAYCTAAMLGEAINQVRDLAPRPELNKENETV